MSIPDVLQEPLSRDFEPQAGRLRALVDLRGDRKELRALEIAALRIGDLIARGAALRLAADEIGQRDPYILQQHAVPAPAVRSAVAVLGAVGTRLPADIFVL